MNSQQIKVFMVDDSPVARDLLGYIMESDPAIKIIGYAQNGEEALMWLKYQTPDVITMDINMPLLDGFETTRRIMQIKPVPIIIISSGYTKESIAKNFQALEAGALAIFEKPQGIHDQPLIQDILDAIHMVAGTKLITRRTMKVEKPIVPPAKQPYIPESHTFAAVAIGASLGGPNAVAKILSSLPAKFPVPIFLAQHISKGFTRGFADWLQKTTSLKMKIPSTGEIALPGKVYIAPDSFHMTVNRNNIIVLEYGERASKPAINKLFKSMAQAYGANAIGVLLTGMGDDGAAELLEMKQKGAFTIAQNEESCVLFGMPKEAIALGGATQVLPLDDIAEVILRLVEQSFNLNKGKKSL